MKLSLQFRGREMDFQNIGREMFLVSTKRGFQGYGLESRAKYWKDTVPYSQVIWSRLEPC